MKWMQTAHQNPDTSEWLSLTKPNLAYEWCSLYWRVKIAQNSLNVITVCRFLTSLIKYKSQSQSQRKVKKIIILKVSKSKSKMILKSKS